MKHLSASMYIGVFIVAFGAIVYQQYTTEIVAATSSHYPTWSINAQQKTSDNITASPQLLPVHIDTGTQSSVTENTQNSTPATINERTSKPMMAMR